MPEQMGKEDTPVVNEIVMSEKTGFGDGLFGFDYVNINVNGLIQHHYRVSLFPIHIVSIVTKRRQVVLEIGLFNKVAFAITLSIL